MSLEQVWGGIAANSFQELMQLFDTCSQALNQALNDIGDGLQGNFVNYTESEQDNIKSIQQVESELSASNLG